MYDIQSKSDFSTGASLVVIVPEHEIDKKALYTIEADMPGFILPFRHRAVDGEIEITYNIGSRSKLTYLSGNRSPGEYYDLWSGILGPLLDCGDWFMNPYSFVLKPEYLYCDKNGKTISYVYIPSVRLCSDENSLKSMVTEVARQNHVTDIELENKVIWAIQDFNPREFLQMIKTYKADSTVKPAQNAQAQEPPHRMVQSEPAFQAPPVPEPVKRQPVMPGAPAVPAAPAAGQIRPDDIVINLPVLGKAPKEEKPKGSLFGAKKEKPAKPQPEPKAKTKGGLFGKKKPERQEIIQGAAAMPNQGAVREIPVAPVYTPQMSADDSSTELDDLETGGVKFRYVGSGEHPRIIEVNIEQGEIFTIGRFDVSVGVKQSSFEFDKKTKAVGRRHAAIERNADGYCIVDLSSQAGTFMDGQKLPPNAPFKLVSGCRISFGYSGADYVWEE